MVGCILPLFAIPSLVEGRSALSSGAFVSIPGERATVSLLESRRRGAHWRGESSPRATVDSERDEVYHAFGPKKNMRIYNLQSRNPPATGTHAWKRQERIGAGAQSPRDVAEDADFCVWR